MTAVLDLLPSHVDARLLAAGVTLQLAVHAVRSRAWFNILKRSYPLATSLRARDVMAASFAGAGINALLPARAGDVVKFACVHRRIQGARYAALVGTAVVETLFETACGVALLAWVLSAGLVPLPSVTPLSGAVMLSLAGAGALGMIRLRRSSPVGIVQSARTGLAMCSSPRQYVAGVASWQALARLVHLGAIGCCLSAFALPATLGTAVLVMAAEGGGRILPIGPVGTGLRMAMLSTGLTAVSGHTAQPAAIAAFTIGTGATMLAVTLTIAIVLIVRELGTSSPRRALRRARLHLAGECRGPEATAVAIAP